MALDDLKQDIIARLPQMRAEYEKLGRLIEAAEAFADDDFGTEHHDEAPKLNRKHAGDPRAPIRSDEFFGMNTHEAVKAYLAHMGKGSPQAPAAISKALVDGGQSTDTEKTAVNVTSALKRLSDKGEVVQVKRGQWGLASWYGAGAKRKDGPRKADNGEANSA